MHYAILLYLMINWCFNEAKTWKIRQMKNDFRFFHRFIVFIKGIMHNYL